MVQRLGSRKRIVILGAGVAGYTAALAIASHVKRRHDVVAISRSDALLFKPSLVWVPFGLRDREAISFPLAPPFQRAGVELVRAEIGAVDLDARLVRTSAGEQPYDFLVIATGATPDFSVVPGLRPHRFVHNIAGWDHADRARIGFENLLVKPGPVVIGAIEGASSFFEAYELVLNLAHRIEKAGLSENVPITFITPEPYVGHLGMGGLRAVSDKLVEAFEKRHIEAITGARVKEIREGVVILADRRHFPFHFSIMAPPLVGPAPARKLEGLADHDGFAMVNDYYFFEKRPEVFACGSAVAVHPVQSTFVECGVPKGGYFAEATARVAARNLVAEMSGESMMAMPAAEVPEKEVLDAGEGGLIVVTDHLLEPRDRTWVLPGPEAHWAKVAFEKLFLARRARGRVKRSA